MLKTLNYHVSHFLLTSQNQMNVFPHKNKVGLKHTIYIYSDTLRRALWLRGKLNQMTEERKKKEQVKEPHAAVAYGVNEH